MTADQKRILSFSSILSKLLTEQTKIGHIYLKNSVYMILDWLKKVVLTPNLTANVSWDLAERLSQPKIMKI